MTSPVSPAPPRRDPAEAGIPQKLTADRIEEMRQWVEGTSLPYRRIGEALGVSAATLSRYAAQEGWRRPAGAAAPARSARERITQRLWKLTERHARALEDQPIEIAGRSLQPLARLTRALGDIDKHASRPLPEEPPVPAPAEPGESRTIHELRDELAAHLARIMAEEAGFEERSRLFEHGGGI